MVPRAPTIDRLKLRRALSNRSIGLAFPFTFLAPLTVISPLTLGVAFLRAGALTPNLCLPTLLRTSWCLSMHLSADLGQATDVPTGHAASC